MAGVVAVVFGDRGWFHLQADYEIRYPTLAAHRPAGLSSVVVQGDADAGRCEFINAIPAPDRWVVDPIGCDQYRGLPYSFRSNLPASQSLTRQYLRHREGWRVLGKQFLVLAARPG